MIFRMIQILFLLVIALLAQFNSAHAKSNIQNLYLEQLSVEDGLSQGTVISLLADEKGFIWLATENGVNIYDGYTFKQLKGPNNSFLESSVLFVKQDNSDFVWINVDNGLYQYHLKTNKYQLVMRNVFDKNAKYVIDVVKGENSQNETGHWIATGKTVGFYQADKNDIQITVDLSEELPEKEDIYKIRYHQQVLYISSRVGLYAYHIELNKWKKLPTVSAKTATSDIKVTEANKVFTFYIDEHNTLYTGTGDGVYSLNIENIKDYIQGLVPAHKFKQIFERLSVWQFLLSNNELYVTSDKGLHVIDTTNQQGQYLFGVSDYFTNVSNNEIISIAKDSSGTFWLGSQSSGVFLWDPSHELIKNYRYKKGDKNSLNDNVVWTIEGDNSNQQNTLENIWVGTRVGLNSIDLKNNTVEQLTEVLQIDKGSNTFEVYSIHQYVSDSLLLYTSKGFFIYDTHLKQTSEFNFDEKTSQILSQDHYSVYLHEKRHLWLVYNENTSVIDLETGQIDTLSELGKVVPQNTIFSFLGLLPNSKTMVVATKSSLWGYDITTRETRPLYKNLDELVSEFGSFDNWVIDENNVFWLSYPTKGLIGLDYPSFEPKYFFNSKNSIIDNNVYSLMKDNEGDIWFSTHKGIFLLDKDTQHIRNFTIPDGFSALEFNGSSNYRLSNGNLAYGSMEGVSIFDPLVLKNKHLNDQINVHVTSISAISRELNLPILINQDEDILLNYDDFGIQIDFSTLSYADKHSVVYQYHLTGDSEVGYPETTDNKITFPNLSSGTHILSVRAKSPITGKYSLASEITIRVSYAPWKSPLAYSVYALFLLVCIFIWLQRRNEKRQLLLASHEEVKFRENRLQLALIGSNSEVWDWQAKDNLIFGKRISQELGYTDKLTAYTFENHVELIHPDDRDNFLAQWCLFIEKCDPDENFSCTYRLKHAAGHWLWYKDLGKIVTLDHKNKPSRITGSYTNITQSRAAEVRSQYYGEAFKQTNDWVLIVNDDFTRVTANQSLRKVFGLPDEEFAFNNNFLGISKERWVYFKNLFPTLKEGGHWRGEELVVTRSGKEFNVVVNINVGRNKATNKLHYICVFTDISAQKIAEKELRYLANYDHLTGLPNRSFLLDRIKHAIELSDRQKKSIALFFIDLDKFKQVNDSLGHDSGDLLLVEVTRRLTELLRGDDTIARIGGDEFVILLESFRDVKYLGNVAQKIIAEVEKPVLLQGNKVSIGASIGIALYPEDARDSSALLRHADVAMYHAKQLGRNTFQVFTLAMHAEATERLTKESNIRLAYNNDEFINHYQPIVDANTDQVVGFELLLRWQRKDELVYPGDFIDIAEELGLIIAMTEAALERGIIDLKKWHENNPALYLSVNLSPRHFAKDNLVTYVADMLDNHNLPAQLLKIEVTESALLSEPEKSIKTMNSLSELGVILALDDFGTGFSSLSYLKRLPLDIIKIDRAFISGIGIEKADEAIVDVTLVLAKRLNMNCIAEGVETEEQLQYMVRRKCHHIQGYIYSKPINADAINVYLNTNAAEVKVI